ncbi:uncharacterized protein LOC141651682 [Silene latifolia]|uniref:uncharacterized protein LOC141651682 n=1 Tax=Silene latifolia TaxID=37657 RepID=UPI003D77CA62
MIKNLAIQYTNTLTCQPDPTIPRTTLSITPSWTPPTSNIVKINVDASWISCSSHAGIGFLLRDHNGLWASGGWKTIFADDPLCAEFFAIRIALLFSLDAGWNNVHLATDCAQAAKLISVDNAAPSRLTNLINDCRVLKDRFQVCQVSFEDRRTNVIADMIAKYARLRMDDSGVLHVLTQPLPWIQQALTVDFQ